MADQPITKGLKDTPGWTFEQTIGCNVLIVGAGDGRIPGQVVKNWAPSQVTICEIDEEVVKTCKEYFPHDGVWDSDLMDWKFEDANEWITSDEAKSRGPFDAVILDCTDPQIGISCGLYTQDFYDNLYNLMKDGAILSQQCDT